MDAQTVIVVILALLSLAFVIRKYSGQSVRRIRQHIAIALMRGGKPGWRRSLGLTIAPDPSAARKSCPGCDGCD